MVGTLEEKVVQDLLRTGLLRIKQEIIADLLAAESIPTNPVDAQDVQRLSPPTPRGVLTTPTTPIAPSTFDFLDIVRFTGGGLIG